MTVMALESNGYGVTDCVCHRGRLFTDIGVELLVVVHPPGQRDLARLLESNGYGVGHGVTG